MGETQASKGMEAEAALICLRERERMLVEKLKQAEATQVMDRKLAADKNTQLVSISDSLILAETQLQEKEQHISVLEAKLLESSKQEEARGHGEMADGSQDDSNLLDL